MMKVLQVNFVYGYGSTGKTVADIHAGLLKRGIKSIVCYGRRDCLLEESQNVYKFCREYESYFYHLLALFGIILPYGGNYLSTKRLLKVVRKEKPDVVHLHCLNGYCVSIYTLLKYLGTKNIKTVVTNHAEFYYTANCGHAYECGKWRYNPGCGECPSLRTSVGVLVDRTAISWQKMKNSFSSHKKDNLMMIAVSPWEQIRIKSSPITKEYECVVVGNGIDTSIFNYKSKIDFNGYTHLYQIRKTSQVLALHVTASFSADPSDIKGGYYILELAKLMPEIKFIVVSLRNNVKSVPRNVIIWGEAGSQKELAMLYNIADISLLTSKRETFSMVTVESLCCGTPVVGFCAGGPETIALEHYSSFVEYGNIIAMMDEVKAMLNKQYNKSDISQEAVMKYSREKMTERYIEIYNKMYRDKNES